MLLPCSEPTQNEFEEGSESECKILGCSDNDAWPIVLLFKNSEIGVRAKESFLPPLLEPNWGNTCRSVSLSGPARACMDLLGRTAQNVKPHCRRSRQAFIYPPVPPTSLWLTVPFLGPYPVPHLVRLRVTRWVMPRPGKASVTFDTQYSLLFPGARVSECTFVIRIFSPFCLDWIFLRLMNKLHFMFALVLLCGSPSAELLTEKRGCYIARVPKRLLLPLCASWRRSQANKLPTC